MRRALLLLGILALAACGTAQAQSFRVVVVPGLGLDSLRGLENRAAVGLLVPANGPTTSGAQARAALARGQVENSYLGGIPKGSVRVGFAESGRLPSAGPAIVLGLPEGGAQPNDRRYPIAVIGPGYRGLLTSDSSRIPGLVSVADVAPTALGTDGRLGSRAADDPIGALAELDARIEDHVDARLPVALLAAVLVLALAFLLPRGGIVGFAVGLAANLAAGAAGLGSWEAILLIGGAILLLTPLVVRSFRSDTALGLLCAAVLAAYLGAMAVDASTVALSPWGPAQSGRFFGVTNLLETMLLVPALAGASLLSRRFGVLGFGTVALLALVTVAGNRFGADGGGAVVLGVGYAVLAVGLLGRGVRALVPALAAAALVVASLTWLDRETGGSSHVTKALGGGAGNVAADIGRRLHISWEHATSGAGPAFVVAASVLLLGLLVADLLRREPRPAGRALSLAFAAAILVSLLVNDAPTDVAVVGLVGFAALRMDRLAPHAPPRPPARAPRDARDRPRRGRLRRREDRVAAS